MENKLGKIYIVGLGPGDRDHFSYRAVQAIEESDVVAGYGMYIDLVKDLLEGKEVISKGMKREIERANLAIEEAKKGKNVAVISGGDLGYMVWQESFLSWLILKLKSKLFQE
jgi:precorrin-3B C17-methyltransferase